MSQLSKGEHKNYRDRRLREGTNPNLVGVQGDEWHNCLGTPLARCGVCGAKYIVSMMPYHLRKAHNK